MKKEKVLAQLNPKFLLGICHRGLHDAENSENGMNAFDRAIKAGMAIELDVHLTADGQLAVFHDSDLTRMTGREGIVEHLTMDELRENYRLPDGEPIPAFKEVLARIDEQVYPL